MKTYLGGACLFLTVLSLCGCGSAAKKVAFRINKTVVTEDEFFDRVQSADVVMMTSSVRSGGPGRAGDVALRSLISEVIIQELAQSRNAAPSEQDINAYLAFMKKAGAQANNPFKSDLDRRRDAKTELAALNLMAGPLNVKDEDYKKAYESMKPGLTEPEQFHMRIIDTKTKARADEAIAMLDKGVSFDTVVSTKSDEAVSKAKGGDIGFVPVQALPPSLLTAIRALKPGEYTKIAVSASVPPYGAQQTSTARETRWFILKLEETKASHTPTFEEVKSVIIQRTVMQKDPGAGQRIAAMVREAIQKADVQVNLKRYETMIAQLKQSASQAPSAPAGAPGVPSSGAVVPGGAAPPQGVAPPAGR